MKIIAFVSLLSLSIFTGCNKNNNSTSPITPVAPKPDTLATGWTRLVVDSTQTINDVFFINPTTGFLADRDYCYKSINGGISWTKLSYPLRLIYNLAVTPDGKFFGVNSSDSIFRSADGGITFTNSRMNSGGQVNDICFSDNNNGFAVTGNGLNQTTNGGLTWAAVSPTTGLATTSGYSSVFFINSTTGWITRGIDIYKTNGNINSWTKSLITGIAPGGNGIVFLSAVSPTVIFAGYDNGSIYKSTDGGITFTLAATLPPITYGLLDVHFLDANNGYCGYGSHIYKTTNGGVTWQPVVSLGSGSIVEIHFVDINNGWGCTTSGSVVRFHQ
jgi:photosystem II stability/assembly factor-like uncharacterized protein